MYRGHTVSVVIPAYNEERLIRNTLTSIPDYVDVYYVIDDCSTDETRSIIAAHPDGRMVPIFHDVNSGVGAAIVSGYKRSRDDGIDVAIVIAGDNQMDPQYFPDLLDPIIDGRCEYSKGDRLVSGEYRTGMSAWRSLGNYMLSFLTKIASGQWHISDPQNGYCAISNKALETIDLDAIYPRYGYCNDLLCQMTIHHLKVRDVPIPARYGEEKSKIRYHTYIPKVSLLLFKLYCKRLKKQYL